MPRKAKSKSTTPRTTPRTTKGNRWGLEFLTTNPDSPLVFADLVKILSQPETWAEFSQDELKEISAKFPDHVPRNEDGSIKIDWLRYNNDWRHAVRLWQIDLEAGRLNPEWLRQAAEAMEDRAAGNFDNFKEEEFEKFWGQKQRVAHLERVGESGRLKLGDLIAANLFEKNDFWVYSRGFGFGANNFEIVKDCKIVEVGDKTITLAIPPGRLRYARESAQEPDDTACSDQAEAAAPESNVVLCTVETVRPLEAKIFEIDGRISDASHRNPWKFFRCERNNQDMGSLFDMRESYFYRTHPD